MQYNITTKDGRSFSVESDRQLTGSDIDYIIEKQSPKKELDNGFSGWLRGNQGGLGGFLRNMAANSTEFVERTARRGLEAGRLGSISLTGSSERRQLQQEYDDVNKKFDEALARKDREEMQFLNQRLQALNQQINDKSTAINQAEKGTFLTEKDADLLNRDQGKFIKQGARDAATAASFALGGYAKGFKPAAKIASDITTGALAGYGGSDVEKDLNSTIWDTTKGALMAALFSYVGRRIEQGKNAIKNNNNANQATNQLGTNLGTTKAINPTATNLSTGNNNIANTTKKPLTRLEEIIKQADDPLTVNRNRAIKDYINDNYVISQVGTKKRQNPMMIFGNIYDDLKASGTDMTKLEPKQLSKIAKEITGSDGAITNYQKEMATKLKNINVGLNAGQTTDNITDALEIVSKGQVALTGKEQKEFIKNISNQLTKARIHHPNKVNSGIYDPGALLDTLTNLKKMKVIEKSSAYEYGGLIRDRVSQDRFNVLGAVIDKINEVLDDAYQAVPGRESIKLKYVQQLKQKGLTGVANKLAKATGLSEARAIAAPYVQADQMYQANNQALGTIGRGMAKSGNKLTGANRVAKTATNLASAVTGRNVNRDLTRKLEDTGKYTRGRFADIKENMHILADLYKNTLEAKMAKGLLDATGAVTKPITHVLAPKPGMSIPFFVHQNTSFANGENGDRDSQLLQNYYEQNHQPDLPSISELPNSGQSDLPNYELIKRLIDLRDIKGRDTSSLERYLQRNFPQQYALDPAFAKNDKLSIKRIMNTMGLEAVQRLENNFMNYMPFINGYSNQAEKNKVQAALHNLGITEKTINKLLDSSGAKGDFNTIKQYLSSEMGSRI